MFPIFKPYHISNLTDILPYRNGIRPDPTLKRCAAGPYAPFAIGCAARHPRSSKRSYQFRPRDLKSSVQNQKGTSILLFWYGQNMTFFLEIETMSWKKYGNQFGHCITGIHWNTKSLLVTYIFMCYTCRLQDNQCSQLAAPLAAGGHWYFWGIGQTKDLFV